MLCMCFYVFRFMYVRLSRPACHHPTQKSFPHSPYFPSFPFIHALFRVFAIVFASYFSPLLLMVVDRLLCLFFYSICYLFFCGYIKIRAQPFEANHPIIILRHFTSSPFVFPIYSIYTIYRNFQCIVTILYTWMMIYP